MAATEITNMVMVYDRDTRKAVVIERERSWQGIAFPGGHLEDGESIYDSAIREIYEETGLKIHNLVSCGFMHWFNNQTGDRYFTYFYKKRAIIVENSLTAPMRAECSGLISTKYPRRGSLRIWRNIL